MLIFNRFDDVQKLQFSGCRVTIGRFQGVHLGHRHLLSYLGGNDPASPKVVVTFDPPPEDILLKKIHQKISSTEEKIKVLEALDVDVVFLIPFDQQIAQLPAEEFAEQYVLKLFHPKKIVVGYDFAFGHNRTGSSDTFKKLAPKTTEVIQVGPFKYKEDIVSTSIIRKKIQEGNVYRAGELLGRPYSVEGTVVDGAKRGRALGFPTINLKYNHLRVLPKEGVYAVNVQIDNEIFLGVCNVGFNPTFTQDHQMKVECHILDFDRDVYHKSVVLQFVERLRDEKKFSSRDELISAITGDIQKARQLRPVNFTPV
ncbi:MAG: bifunctional riboflavin kinase/FAD synthetase [Bdellovibrionaceae bacterium]|nr:bifunctional riboflavin kinase/FAD synthetase [Pseudobdellovibrionaceae bacterium]